MKKMRLIYILFLVNLGLLVSCSDIFVPDISGSTVTLTAPADSSRSDHYTQTFIWDKLDDAEKYNLQIVTPAFEQIESFILDSTISQTQFSITLFPGTFTWRVRALNSEYNTNFTTAVLFIDSTPNLDQVILQKPDNGSFTNDTIIYFTWSPHPNADSYRFDVQIGNDTLGPYYTTADHLTFPNQASSTPKLTEGYVRWKVRALNTESQSVPSERTLTIDLTAPGKPTLTEPANNDTVLTATVDFLWQYSTTGGSPVSDSIFIYRDTTNILVNSLISNGMSWQESNMAQGKYSWMVRSFDAAGNLGPYSEKRKFVVKLSH